MEKNKRYSPGNKALIAGTIIFSMFLMFLMFLVKNKLVDQIES